MKKSIAIIITAIILFAGCSLDNSCSIHNQDIITTTETNRGSNDGFVLPVCNKQSCPNKGKKMTKFYKSIFKNRVFKEKASYDCEHCDYFHEHTREGLLSLNIYECTGCGNRTGGTKKDSIKCTSTTPNKVEIPDYGLRRLIQKQLGKPKYATLTKKDLLNVIKIEDQRYYGQRVENLAGLQFCINLERIYLINDNITDLTAIKNLNKLDSIHMDNCNITDLSPLKGLTNLEHLKLWNNKVSDLSPLKNIYSLYEINFSNNNLTSIDPLSNMRLAYVTLSGNKIKKLPKFKNHKFMWRFDFSNNEITDISNLNGTWIKDINLNNNNIKDISSLKNNDKLEELYIENNSMDVTIYSNNKKVIDSLTNRPTPCKVTWKNGNRI